MAESLKKQLERRHNALKAERSSFIPIWQEITSFISPRTARYLTVLTNKGAKAYNSIINNAATVALRTFKSGMMAGASSPARPWFRITLEEKMMKSTEVKAWLYEIETSMRGVLTKSNFYESLPLVYGALGAYGTGCQLIEEDEDEVIRCFPLPIGSYCLAMSDKNVVDSLYRDVPMTVGQMVKKFGIENVSIRVKNLYDQGNTEQWIEIVHAIEPNTTRDVTKLNAKDKPWRSVYFEVSGDGDKLLRESGYDEFPVQAPRWDVEAEDVYGYGCGDIALGDVKQLQLEEKNKTIGIEKATNPAMIADASLQMQRTSTLPGGITYIAGLATQQHASFRKAVDIDPRINELRQDIQAIEYRIKRAFYEDMMLMFATSDNPQQTAREVDERHQEKLLILGPFLERMNNQLYDPALARIYAIMNRRGMIPPPPAEIAGYPLNVQYTSIMAQAQKLIGTASVERVVGFVGNLLSLGFTDAADKLDIDATIEEYSSMHGTPPTMLRSEDAVTEIRDRKAKAEQAQQAMAAMPAMSQAATAAKTLSETNVGDTAALAAMIGAP